MASSYDYIKRSLDLAREMERKEGRFFGVKRDVLYKNFNFDAAPEWTRGYNPYNPEDPDDRGQYVGQMDYYAFLDKLKVGDRCPLCASVRAVKEKDMGAMTYICSGKRSDGGHSYGRYRAHSSWEIIRYLRKHPAKPEEVVPPEWGEVCP